MKRVHVGCQEVEPLYITSTHRPHGKLPAKLDCTEQEEEDEAMEEVGEEGVSEGNAPKKQRLDMEDVDNEDLEQDHIQSKEELQLEQDMDEGDEEEEDDCDEEEEEEENEELTKDRCGRHHLVALTHSSHGIMYQPPSSEK